jgi:hypothetical protein
MTDTEGRRHTLTHAAAVVGGYLLLHAALAGPALSSGRLLLEPTDSAGYHYPAVYAPFSPWEPNVYGGYPRVADPQMMNWYPPALLLRLTGAEWLWNPFVLSAGVLASVFTYGLAYRLTGSRLGAALAGTVYGLGSFMALHTLHLTIIHAAAWVPLVLWSLAELRLRRHRGWVLVLALAVALAILGGHPQVAAYGLALAAVFVAVHLPGAPAGWRSFAGSAALGVVLGLGLTALQTWPTAELMPRSARQATTYAMFTSYALPARELPILLFPYAYGGGTETAPAPYFGKWNLAEVSGFCGLLSLVLAVAGFVATRRTRGARLWAALAVLALLAALGNGTPAGWLLFRVPLLNKFRCPARLFMTYQLAVAVLAASGVRALAELPRRAGARALGLGTAAVAVALAVGWAMIRFQMARGTFCPVALPDELARRALSPWPWVNPELGRPLVLFALGAAALWAWFLRPGRVAAGLLAAAFVADVTQMGGYTAAGSGGSLPAGCVLGRPPAALEALRAEMETTGERFLAADPTIVFAPGETPTAESAHANLALLWGLANAEGYSPLEISRLRELLGAARRERTTAELLGVRYLAQFEAPPGGPDGTADGDLWQVVSPAGSRLRVERTALPLRRAWLVGRATALPADEVRAAVIGRAPLPDGTAFRPYETALVEQPVPFAPAALGSDAEAVVSLREPCRVEVRAHAPDGGFLVLGDVYYPGWRATIDGRPAKVYPTDYVLRGVVVPPGDHVVEFRYRPTTFYLGLGVSGLSAALLLGLLLVRRKRYENSLSPRLDLEAGRRQADVPRRPRPRGAKPGPAG